MHKKNRNSPVHRNNLCYFNRLVTTVLRTHFTLLRTFQVCNKGVFLLIVFETILFLGDSYTKTAHASGVISCVQARFYVPYQYYALFCHQMEVPWSVDEVGLFVPALLSWFPCHLLCNSSIRLTCYFLCTYVAYYPKVWPRWRELFFHRRPQVAVWD